MPLRFHAILSFLLFLLPLAVFSQEAGLPPVARSVRPILVGVDFSGNSSISSAELESVVQSTATGTSFYTRLARRVHPVSERLSLFLRMRAAEVREFRYLNKAVVETDKEAIARLYRERGFHEVQVRAGYAIDTAQNTARVRFEVREGERAIIWGVSFEGLEDIPAELRSRVEQAPYLRPDASVDIVNIDLEIRRALDLLKNSGYAFATQLRPPRVIYCYAPECETPRDSIIIYLFPGTRYRFGPTAVRHDTVSGKRLVSEDLIRDQIEYQPGEWFSWRKVEETRRSLYRLGVFEQLSVDTTGPITGDTLPMKIGYRLRDQYEMEVSGEVSAAPRGDEIILAAGTAARFTRLNLFGRGIRASVGTRLQGQLERLWFPKFAGAEWGLDGRLDVPKPVLIPSDVVSLSAGYGRAVEDRINSQDLLSTRFNAGVELGWALSSYTLLTGVTARLLYQNNSYDGVGEYIRAKADALIDEVTLPDGCTPEEVRQDLDNIVETLARTIYRVQVLQGDSPELAPSAQARELSNQLSHTAIVGVSATGDHRNDFFSPTKGYFAEARLDLGITGAAVGGFVRGEVDGRYFIPSGARNTWGMRLHLGAIGQFGGFPLTPIGSRFHAGGANSIRGWGVREMLVTTLPETFGDSCTAPVYQAILDDSRRLLGGLMLLEGSVEYRARWSDSWVGIFFLDLGNAYFQNYNLDKEIANLSTIVQNIGVATGINIGFDTPAGPIRGGLGIPLWNPIDYRPGRQGIWQHPLVFFKDVAFQFTIGHAF